jgi:hypothetical protein
MSLAGNRVPCSLSLLCWSTNCLQLGSPENYQRQAALESSCSLGASHGISSCQTHWPKVLFLL